MLLANYKFYRKSVSISEIQTRIFLERGDVYFTTVTGLFILSDTELQYSILQTRTLQKATPELLLDITRVSSRSENGKWLVSL